MQNVNPVAIGIFCGHLILAFPELSQKNRQNPLVARVEEAITSADVVYDEVLAWAVHLAQHINTGGIAQTKLDSKEAELLKVQAALIEVLLGLTKTLSKRLKDVEALLEYPAKRKAHAVGLQTKADKTPKPKKARKAASTILVDTWFEWYACRMYSRVDADPKTSDTRNVVAFIKLFAGDFACDEAAPGFATKPLLSPRKLSHTSTRSSSTMVSSQGSLILEVAAKPPMPIQPALPNEICTVPHFMRQFVSKLREITTKKRKFYFEESVVRHLRLTIIMSVEGKEFVSEALGLMLLDIASKAPRGRRSTTIRMRMPEINEWLVHAAADDDDSETKFVADQSLEERSLYGALQRHATRRRRFAATPRGASSLLQSGI